MANTPYYNLYKPNRLDNDPVDITLASNFTIIDNEIKNRENDLDTHEASTTAHDSENLTHGTTSVKQALDSLDTRIGEHEASTTAHDSEDITYGASNVKQGLDNLDSRVSTIIASSGTSDTEVVDARGTFAVLHDRLANTDAQLAEKAAQSDLADLGTNAKKFITLADAITQINTGTNKILFIPDGTYSISSSLTISGDNISVQMAPNAKIVSTVSAINALIFTGKNCSLTGGTIEYPAIFEGTNRKWEDYEAMVLVNGDGFKAENVTLNNVYKVGFGIRNANDCIITNNKINGNYPAASYTGVETSHYGIAYDPKGVTDPDGNIIISGNIVKSCVQGVFIGNYDAGVGYAVNISNNVFNACHNHGIYSNGSTGAVINANSFNRCSLAIACLGKYSTITNNNIYTYSTGNNLDLVGISVREASHCVISHNVIKGDVPASSVVIDLLNLSTDPAPNDTINDNIVSENIIDVTGGDVIGIRVGHNSFSTNCRKNQVKNNIIKATGRANLGLITIYTTTTSTGLNNQVTGNTITVTNNCYAIYMYRQKNAIVSGNVIKLEYNASGAEVLNLLNSIKLEDSIISQNVIGCDVGYGTNITLRGIIEDSASARNLITGNSIKFDSTTLTAKAEIVIQAVSKSANNMVNGAYVA